MVAAGVAGAAMVAAGAAGAPMVAAGAPMLAADAPMLAAGVPASVVAVVSGLLAAEVAVASVVAVAFVVAVAAAAGSASGSMTTSVAGGTVTWGTVAAAHPGEGAAGAKSHDLTAGLTKHSASATTSISSWCAPGFECNRDHDRAARC